MFDGWFAILGIYGRLCGIYSDLINIYKIWIFSLFICFVHFHFIAIFTAVRILSMIAIISHIFIYVCHWNERQRVYPNMSITEPFILVPPKTDMKYTFSTHIHNIYIENHC